MKKIHTKTRTLIILIVLVVGIGLGMTYFLKGKAKATQQLDTRTSTVPNISSIPGGAISEKYQALQEEENKRKVAEAKKTGGSSVATIIGNKKNTSELFGIEGQVKQCPPCNIPSVPLDRLAMAKNLAKTDPEAFKRLMLSDPALAAQLAKDDPELFKRLILEDPEFAKAMAAGNPELIKELMKKDPKFAVAFGKKNPELVKALMANDPAFATMMARNNPELVKALMANDPAFAAMMARNNPELSQEISNLTVDRKRLQAIEENRKKQQEKQEMTAKESQINNIQAQQLAAILANMDSQSKAMFQAWNEITPQQSTAGEWATSEDDKKKSGESNGKTKNKDGGPESTSASSTGPVLLKAGTILFAVLDTVVSGTLKGAKLLGIMGTSTPPTGAGLEAVTLTFNTLSLPDRANSMPINAIAVDTETARTALADDVDHHYLMRYSTMFASAFMEGYAKVITSQGSVQTSSANGLQTTTQSPTLSNRQTVFAALGEVGKKWGEAVSDYINRPNTVTIESGSGFGLLFLADVPG